MHEVQVGLPATRFEGLSPLFGTALYTCRLTTCNLQLLETLLDEGKSVDCFGLCFADRLSATVTTSLGPLCARSPGRVPIAPILPMNGPEPVKGVMKEATKTKKLAGR